MSQTGLLRFEKAEIASELIHHFLDGHDRGRTWEELVRDFGKTDVAGHWAVYMDENVWGEKGAFGAKRGRKAEFDSAGRTRAIGLSCPNWISKYRMKPQDGFGVGHYKLQADCKKPQLACKFGNQVGHRVGNGDSESASESAAARKRIRGN